MGKRGNPAKLSQTGRVFSAFDGGQHRQCGAGEAAAGGGEGGSPTEAVGHGGSAVPTGSVAKEPDNAERKAAPKRWANLIRHIYEVDPLLCPRCGGAMKIISFITEQRAIRAILDSVRRSGTSASAGSLHPPPAARPAEAGVH